MDHLWAPWRADYITKTSRCKCFLCAYPKRNSDRKHNIVERSTHAFAILNLYPYNVGHLLVAPYAHKGDLLDLTDDEALDIHRLAARMKKRLDRKVRPQGYNLGVNLGLTAGAGLPGHYHLHLVPRWNGDTNFMPVAGDTRVLPIPLDDLYGKLAAPKTLKNVKKGPRKRR